MVSNVSRAGVILVLNTSAVESSTACTVRLGAVPLKCVTGTKRRRESLSINTPASVLAVPISAQFVPLFEENCHAPSVLASAVFATTTIPTKLLAVVSFVSWKFEPPSKLSTDSPLGAVTPSSMLLSVAPPTKEGASLTTLMLDVKSTPNSATEDVPSSAVVSNATREILPVLKLKLPVYEPSIA